MGSGGGENLIDYVLIYLLSVNVGAGALVHAQKSEGDVGSLGAGIQSWLQDDRLVKWLVG